MRNDGQGFAGALKLLRHGGVLCNDGQCERLVKEGKRCIVVSQTLVERREFNDEIGYIRIIGISPECLAICRNGVQGIVLCRLVRSVEQRIKTFVCAA